MLVACKDAISESRMALRWELVKSIPYRAEAFRTLTKVSTLLASGMLERSLALIPGKILLNKLKSVILASESCARMSRLYFLRKDCGRFDAGMLVILMPRFDNKLVGIELIIVESDVVESRFEIVSAEPELIILLAM